jgi:hypothetical protein
MSVETVRTYHPQSSLVCLLMLYLGASEGGSAPPSTYKQYRLESLCAHKTEKESVYLHNRPAIFTFNSTNRNRIECHLELHISEFFGFSIFTEVMKLDETRNCEKDFLQFGRDFLVFTSHKSKKRCGEVERTKRIHREDGTLLKIEYGNTDLRSREYIEQEDKEMDVWLSITPPAPGQGRKELMLVVTPFKKACVKEDHYYWKCPSTNKCIKRELFCDGQINCDGLEKEEQTEYCLRSINNAGVDMFISIPIIILIVVFSIVALMFIIFVIKLFAHHFKPRHEGSDRVRRSVHDPLTLCQPTTSSGRGLRGLQAQLSRDPSAPCEEDILSPAVLPPHPPSYTEAVGSTCPVYHDDPPKYSEVPDEVNNSNANILFKGS